MQTQKENGKDQTPLWEILVILLIWLMAASLVYIVFWKTKIELNFK